MIKKHVKPLACAALTTALVLGAAGPSSGSDTHVVHPGESIQAAVDAARPGDTVVVAPGVYRESVLVTKPGLTLRGAGRETVLLPAAATTRAANTCATAGNGICVLGTASETLADVRIRSLTLSGHKNHGIWASRTDALRVTNVVSEKNGIWGIAQERSTRGYFARNVARDNGDAGIFLANTVDTEGGATDTQGARVRDNRLEGNRIGATVRRVRNLSVEGNTFTGNCGALFIVGDESKPRAGAMTVTGNRIHDNNKLCPKTARLPVIQGSGIVLTGAEDTVVTGNEIRDNVGSSPLSGGIVLSKSFVGAANTGNVIRDNVVLGNRTADLVTTGSETGNTIEDNECGVSQPAGAC